MIKFYKIDKKDNFIGRKYELKRLKEIDDKQESSVIVVKGRRRIGKTELIEQFFINHKVLKFEGIQVKKSQNGTVPQKEIDKQYLSCLMDLRNYFKNHPRYHDSGLENWHQFFELLIQYTEDVKEKLVLYFEEIQWLACYSDDFLAIFKKYYDNHFRKMSNIRIVISGSEPSFITGQFQHSSAMYGRDVQMFTIEPLNISEVQSFLDVGKKEAMMAMLCIGGIPGYLKRSARL